MQITGKVALVTGAGGALGAAIVSQLVAAGASVIALDKNEQGLKALPAGVTAIACDVADSVAVENALADVPPVDILINNVGILHSAPLVNIVNKDDARFAQAAEQFRQVMDVNLLSVFYVTQIIADRMARERKKGIIVNISSVSARGNAGQSAYAASKAGMNALTAVWAKELGMLGIRCAAIAPGYIDTPSTRKAVSEAQLQAITDKVPLKKLGDTSHILQAIRFVIDNDYVNGTVIDVDGGLVV
ncbi:MAG: SDR family NAD(P)-dependent oxidoreductase [Rickettsiales bacterium]|nr:SDR family NAD(P)-dependent oxidoreductase [Rickettsiales bacterium]